MEKAKISAVKKTRQVTKKIASVKEISIELNSEFETIKTQAIAAAKKDKCNYNIIFDNPTQKGEFDLKNSNFKYVKDAYFLYNRPHIKFVCKTDDLIN